VDTGRLQRKMVTLEKKCNCGWRASDTAGGIWRAVAAEIGAAWSPLVCSLCSAESNKA